MGRIVALHRINLMVMGHQPGNWHGKAGLEVDTRGEAFLFSVPYCLGWFAESKWLGVGLLVVYAKETVTTMEQILPVKESMPYFSNQIIQITLSLSFKKWLYVFRKSGLIVSAVFWKLKGRSNVSKSCGWEEWLLAQPVGSSSRSS